jgi:hypothetical protein
MVHRVVEGNSVLLSGLPELKLMVLGKIHLRCECVRLRINECSVRGHDRSSAWNDGFPQHVCSTVYLTMRWLAMRVAENSMEKFMEQCLCFRTHAIDACRGLRSLVSSKCARIRTCRVHRM